MMYIFSFFLQTIGHLIKLPSEKTLKIKIIILKKLKIEKHQYTLTVLN